MITMIACGGGGGVRHLLSGERPEELLHQQHDEALIADDHARRFAVGEPGIEGESEPREEGFRLRQVLHGQVEKGLGGQGDKVAAPPRGGQSAGWIILR
jgi:hypothetical protein